MSIQIRVKALIMEPITAAEAPVGSLYLDADNSNAPTIKSSGGVPAPINSADTSMFLKQMQAGGPIPNRVPVSKRPDGKIIEADSDAVNAQNFIGFSMQVASANGDLINVLTVGANIENAILGLGFVPGDEIYLSENMGYTNDPASFTGNNDSIIKVGIADCSAGIASSTAKDLIAFSAVVARPA